MSRRAVLTAAAMSVPLVLAGCVARSDPAAGASHPALRAPQPYGVVALLDVPAEPVAAARALRLLADAVRGTSATVGVGASWFDKAGLVARRPAALGVMPPFPGDLLDPRRTHPDLLLQVEGPTGASAKAALSSLLLRAEGVSVRWHAAGSRPENAVRDGRALMRNNFGFVDGLANRDLRDGPDVDAVTLIRAGAGVPEWAVGGTYLALRVIRTSSELWDDEPLAEQARIIGRHPDGRWLDGTPTGGEPDYTRDPAGDRTPLDSHVRRANPRDGSPPPPLIRRSWSYSTGSQDEGVLFMSYQADITTGFEAVQRRLAGQRLDDYILTVGGGYFVVPPQDRADRPWERTLLG